MDPAIGNRAYLDGTWLGFLQSAWLHGRLLLLTRGLVLFGIGDGQ
jgi:hypothetical protein